MIVVHGRPAAKASEIAGLAERRENRVGDAAEGVIDY
jgi:hypothetical protein